MNKIFTLLVLTSCNMYGMKEPGLNSATEKYVQICAINLHYSSPNHSQENFADILTKIMPENTKILRNNALNLFSSMATALDQSTGQAYHAVNLSVVSQAFRELSHEERQELRQQ